MIVRRLPGRRLLNGHITHLDLDSQFRWQASRFISGSFSRLQSGLSTTNITTGTSQTDSISNVLAHQSHAKPPPLSIVSLTFLLRSLATATISSNPILLRPSLFIMSHLAHSKSLLLNPDRNQMLRWLLKKTFYAQFCAGENSKEVRTTINELRGLGFGGVILSYAKEVVLDHGTAKTLEHTDFILNEQDALRAVELWRNATLETVRMTGNGDFVALKLTGAGPQAMHHLTHSLPPPPSLEKAIVDICDLASARGVKLLFDAEQQAVQNGIDAWTLNFMRRYNGHTTTVYGTYQAYLKSCATTVAEHLSVARREHFNLGVKLVRGAYLASDPRHLIHDDKVATDATFDGISEALIRRSFNDVLLPAAGETTSIFPPVSIVLASHNHTSVDKAQKILESNHVAGKPPTDIVYAQLQGMADEVSCALLQAGSDSGLPKHNDAPRVYKYLTWGTTGECMKYLLRRAEENRDAVARTKEGRDALATELWRRIRLSVGLGV